MKRFGFLFSHHQYGCLTVDVSFVYPSLTIASRERGVGCAYHPWRKRQMMSFVQSSRFPALADL
jgi:hypothetical protein